MPCTLAAQPPQQQSSLSTTRLRVRHPHVTALHSHQDSALWKHYMHFCRVYMFIYLQLLWILQVHRCQTEFSPSFTFLLAVRVYACIHMASFRCSDLTWCLCKIVPHTCLMTFLIFLSITLLPLSFSFTFFCFNIIKSFCGHCTAFLLCLNFLLLVSLWWTKSCCGVELSLIKSSWINTNINTGNHPNHAELIS